MLTQVDKNNSKDRPETLNKICHVDFHIEEIQPGKKDKLGNDIMQVLWYGSNYIVYKSGYGVCVHFSNDKDIEKAQRDALTIISPELCELRYLTSQMRGDGLSLYDFNIAQSIMLLLENKTDDAVRIAKAALDLAVIRTTADNTIRYVRSCMQVASVLIVAVIVSAIIAHNAVPDNLKRGIEFFSTNSHVYYSVAAIFGVLGAVFSILTRIQDFKMKPCQQSYLNDLMAGLRVGIGLIGGAMLYLIIEKTSVGKAIFSEEFLRSWRCAALLGFLGGYVERLVQTVFQRTGNAIEDSFGTPVQKARDNKSA
ncbi:hypothetical protein [Methylocystis sp.]|uniref:hypothetical protein n=1 Tax=Methylocystis sp. TaxID=1911079 RepID=UPI003DA645EE